MSLRDKLVAATQAALEAKRKKRDTEAEDQERRVAAIIAECTSVESPWNKNLVELLESAANEGQFLCVLDEPGDEGPITSADIGYMTEQVCSRFEHELSQCTQIYCRVRRILRYEKSILQFTFSWETAMKDATRKRKQPGDE